MDTHTPIPEVAAAVAALGTENQFSKLLDETTSRCYHSGDWYSNKAFSRQVMQNKRNPALVWAPMDNRVVQVLRREYSRRDNRNSKELERLCGQREHQAQLLRCKARAFDGRADTQSVMLSGAEALTIVLAVVGFFTDVVDLQTKIAVVCSGFALCLVLGVTVWWSERQARAYNREAEEVVLTDTAEMKTLQSQDAKLDRDYDAALEWAKHAIMYYDQALEIQPVC